MAIMSGDCRIVVGQLGSESNSIRFWTAPRSTTLEFLINGVGKLLRPEVAILSSRSVARGGLNAKPDPVVSGSFRFIAVPPEGLPRGDA